MHRFTIGSLLTGGVLAVGAIAVLGQWSGARAAATAVHSGMVAPGSGPEPLAVDPVRGSVSLGQEAANDYELNDGSDWSGGMDSATW